MKTFLFLVSFCFSEVAIFAQSFPPDEVIQRNLEELAAREEVPEEDDSYWQALENFARHPLNINQASATDLAAFPFLSPIQISAFFGYRTLLGSLLSYYELQAIPGWDLETIRKIRAFIYIERDGFMSAPLRQQIRDGAGNFLFRYSRVLEKSKGYEKPVDPSAAYFLGSPDKLFFRYNFSYKKILHVGFLGEKDAGEPFFGKYQPYGFDFYSFHLFLGQWGIIKNLVIGDFTINLGQGLIQWQSLGFGKGGNVLEVKRQSATIRPYGSAGEINFHRGLGITVSKNRWEIISFLSIRKPDANLETDSLSRGYISSFENSGLHRTSGELADKNNIRQLAFGFKVGYQASNMHFGLNGISYQFSQDILPADLPYNLYAIRGRNWANASLDYAFTFKNVHGFGEFALDKKGHKAFIAGFMASLGRDAGLAVLYRNISASYEAINANAFTENTKPANENGFYLGLNLHSLKALQFDFFFDIYQFPWLRYRADGPGFGKELFVQAKYNPSKSWNIYMRYKYESKLGNGESGMRGNRIQVFQPKHNWRMELALMPNRSVELRSRTEFVWLNNATGGRENGFLTLLGCQINPPKMPFSGNFCLQYFETSSYSTRIYVYENDVLFALNLPAYFDKGYHYYMNLRVKLNQLFGAWKRQKPAVDLWLRWSEGIYEKNDNLGSGLDEILGNTRSEWKLQIFFNW